MTISFGSLFTGFGGGIYDAPAPSPIPAVSRFVPATHASIPVRQRDRECDVATDVSKNYLQLIEVAL